MKIIHAAAILFCSALLISTGSFSQKNKQRPIDTVLEAKSEKWKVKLHKGMFGMAKPEFGPFTTIDLNKLDSPILRKKVKEGSYSEGSYAPGEEWDWDFSKYETIEKRKMYSMLVASASDTAEVLFSVYRISHEKNLTFFGSLISKNDEGKSQVLGYKTNVSGIGITRYDSLPWRFFLEDSVGRKEETYESAKFTGGYILSQGDSLFTEPMLNNTGSPNSPYFRQWQTGIFINGTKDNHIAALKFKNPGDPSNAFYAWIRNDLALSHQHAIAAVFSVLISAKTQ